MTTPIDFKWKMVANGAYEALAMLSSRQSILLTATKAMHGKYWFWSAQLHHDHDDLQEYIEIRLVARTLAESKEQSEIVVDTLIKTMKALHEVEQ